jgi:TPR repeat protein
VIVDVGVVAAVVTAGLARLLHLPMWVAVVIPVFVVVIFGALFLGGMMLSSNGATYYMGSMAYEEGRIEEAERFYRRAADNGHTSSMYSLGRLLHQAGRIEEAEQWYRRAADNGHASSMYRLGHLLKKAERIEDAEQKYQHTDDT